MISDQPEIYGEGLCYMSVCSPLSVEDTEAWVRRHHIAGTKRGWRLSSEKTFACGEPNPSPCNKAAGRMHYLFDC